MAGLGRKLARLTAAGAQDKMSDGTFQTLETVARAVEIFAFLGGLGWGAYWLGQFKQEVTMSINDLKEATKKIGDILLIMATERQRVTALEKRLEDLRHGDGFVRPFPWDREH